MRLQHIFTASAQELATGKVFEALPEDLHEPIVTALELSHRHRARTNLDLSIDSARDLDKLVGAAVRAKPKNVSRLVRSVGCYVSALLLEQCDAEFVPLAGGPFFLRFGSPAVVYTSGIRLAIDAWENKAPRFHEALTGLVEHVKNGGPRPSFVPSYDFGDATEKLHEVWLYAHSLQAIYGRFEDGSWNLLYAPQTLRRIDDMLSGDLDEQLAIRLGTVSAAIEGINSWQASAAAAFFGELVREQLGGRWIQPERGPLEMDLGLDDTLFSPHELCRQAVRQQRTDYPMTRAYQALMDFRDNPSSAFPLEDTQLPRQAPVDDGETEATQAWSIAHLAAGAAAQQGGQDNQETREAPSPSQSELAGRGDEREPVTMTRDVSEFTRGDGPEPGGSTRKYDVNELQRALTNAQHEQPGGATKQYDGAALAAAFKAKQAAPEGGDGDSTRQYSTDELLKGLGPAAFRTTEQPAVHDDEDDEAGMSTREYDAASLARGMPASTPDPEQGVAPPPDPFGGLMDEEPQDPESLEIEIDASFDPDDLYDQMLDDPDFASQDKSERPRHGVAPSSGTAKIQTMEEWTDERDSSEDGIKSGPVTQPVSAVHPNLQQEEGNDDETRDVGLFLPTLAKLRVKKKESELDRVRSQLMPVLVPPDWERLDQVAARPLLNDFIGSPLVTVAVDYPEKLVYINNSDIKEWTSSFGILRTMALENLSEASADLAGKFTEVDIGPKPIFQLSTGDYFEASRILLTGLGATGEQLLGSQKLWVAIPNRNILLLTAATTQKQLEALAEVTRYCFDEKDFALSPEVFLYSQPGPAVQKVVVV